jgi:hypothetical protein
MYKRNLVLALAGGTLCIILGFLFVGSAYAACSGNVCVIEPSLGDNLRSGRVSYIVLEINWDRYIFPTSKYKLFYTCKGSDFQKNGKQVWRLITTRYCNPYSGCPLEYPWEVPFVERIETPVRDCAVGVVVFDESGKRLGSSRGAAFKILPFSTPFSSPYFMPYEQHVVPGSSADYNVFGGKPPYNVTTSNPDITTINGLTPPQTFTDSPPVTISIENYLTSPCVDTKVTIILKDGYGTTTEASYIIDCP